MGLLSSLLVSLGMRYSQELVIGIIDVQLKRVTVISEESVVSVGQVSQSTSLKKIRKMIHLQGRKSSRLGIDNTWV